MTNVFNCNLTLGINGFGRIGKLTLWHHVARRSFGKIVINIGRKVGTSLRDVVHYIERDSSYGSLQRYLYGCRGEYLVTDIDDERGTFILDGVEVTVLREKRNPVHIDWYDHNVKLVVDTTGQFTDPTLPADSPMGALQGHFESGVEKVILSAPFKIKDKHLDMPHDAVTTVMGINEHDYDPAHHRMISAASCTTTCLAHMMKPIMDAFGVDNLLTASMSTVHAATGSQEVLDRMAKAGAKDLRKSRSILNNIILTTTGAATTLEQVIPEMKQIGFIAESVRIPTTTGSLVILVLNFQEEQSEESIRREVINNIYKQASESDPRGYLVYTEEQNVSSDIIGLPKAAAVIEAHETHTRTAEITIDLKKTLGIPQNLLESINETIITVPITQAVIYGWYDNELGSYVNILGDRTVTVAEMM